MSKLEHLHFLSALTHIAAFSTDWYKLRTVIYNQVEVKHKKPCSNFAYLAHIVQLNSSTGA